MECKPRLKHFSLFTTTDINVSAGGIPIIFQHHFSFISRIFFHVWIQYLRITDRHPGSLFFMENNSRHTRHFLFQIININSRLLFFSRSGSTLFHHIHWGIKFPNQFRRSLIHCRPGTSKSWRHRPKLSNRRRFYDHWRLPFPVIICSMRIILIFICFSGVIDFSGKKSRIHIGTLPIIFPILSICSENFPAAIFICENNFRQYSFLISKIIIISHCKGLSITPPTGCQRYAHAIFPCRQLLCNIVSLIIHPLIVLCKSRRKQAVSNFFSIDPALIDSSGCDIQSCFH